MPELPEVETVTNSVKKHIINESFDSMTVLWAKTLHNFQLLISKKKFRVRMLLMFLEELNI